MQSESTDMAMAYLANLAKFDPHEGSFSRFSQKSHSHPSEINLDQSLSRLILEPSLSGNDQGGHDLPPANDPSALPPDLVHAALAACRAYGDGKAAQDELLEDLTHYPPEQYSEIAAHLRSRLNKVRCADCMHSGILAGIAKCRVGVESGLPISGRWATDLHICPWHFKSRDSPKKAKNKAVTVLLTSNNS